VLFTQSKLKENEAQMRQQTSAISCLGWFYKTIYKKFPKWTSNCTGQFTNSQVLCSVLI